MKITRIRRNGPSRYLATLSDGTVICIHSARPLAELYPLLTGEFNTTSMGHLYLSSDPLRRVVLYKDSPYRYTLGSYWHLMFGVDHEQLLNTAEQITHDQAQT